MDISGKSAQRNHRRRQYSVRAVLQHHHSGPSRRGRQFAVGRRRRLRHHCRFRGDPGREYFQKFSRQRRSTASRSCATLPKVVTAKTRPEADPTAARGPTACALFSPARCKSTRRCFSPPPSPSPRSCRYSPCRASRARFSIRWRGPTVTRCSERCWRPSRSRRCWPPFCFPSISKRPKRLSSVRCAGSIRRCCAGRWRTGPSWS